MVSLSLIHICLRLRNDGAKHFAFMHRDIGQDLAVELDTGELKPVHEFAVGQAFNADGRIDALDPQATERPLLGLSCLLYTSRCV